MKSIDGTGEGLCRGNRMDESYRGAIGGKMGLPEGSGDNHRPRGRKPPERNA